MAMKIIFRLSAGLDALVAAGLITAERKVELLTP
jgi:tRNA U34 2-thiouridine synthase MnmA/TrmU